MRLKKWYCVLLLIFVVLMVYYPSLYAGVNSVDDVKMIAGIQNSGPFDLGRHFFPDTKRYYYRPLTTLTYLGDRDVWGMLASFMHLENIILHLGCTLLVFFITRRLMRIYNLHGQGIAFVSALLFALHPLASESVCWISGRTDLLAGLFLLLALLLLLAGLEKGTFFPILLAGIFLLFSCLSKEVAVFALPGFLWIVAMFPSGDNPLVRRLLDRWFSFGVLTASVSSYFFMRHLALAKDTGIKAAITGAAVSDFDLWNKLRIAFKVYGFYLKKVFIPWPLNFGIVEVSDWYVLFGIALFCLLLWMALRRDIFGALVLTAFSILSPAILVVFGKMAWTPIAERYLYIPLALCIPALTILCYRRFEPCFASTKKLMIFSCVTILAVLFTSTTYRAWVWQDNLRLYEDTVKKSPTFVAAKAELANAYLRKGEIEKAADIFSEIKNNGNNSGYLIDDINLALIQFNQGKYQEAYEGLLPKLDKKNKRYYDVLQALLRINDQRISRAKSSEDRLVMQKESLFWLQEQYQIRPAPFILYRTGKMQLLMGDKMAALKSFRAAMEKAPSDAHYRGAAMTFIENLEGS